MPGPIGAEGTSGTFSIVKPRQTTSPIEQGWSPYDGAPPYKPKVPTPDPELAEESTTPVIPDSDPESFQPTS